jgi:hypothetical protein
MTETRKKRALLVSDDESVSKIIELAIGGAVTVIPLKLKLSDSLEDRGRPGNWDLIILALSSYASEPLVALANAGVPVELGQVPLLVISDRPFTSDRKVHIHHLDFPFSVAQLSDAIHHILPPDRAPNGNGSNHSGNGHEKPGGPQ